MHFDQPFDGPYTAFSIPSHPFKDSKLSFLTKPNSNPSMLFKLKNFCSTFKIFVIIFRL